MDKERLTKLEATVENIRDNHLVHLQQDVNRVCKKIDKLDNRLWLVMLGVMGILATVVVERLF